MTNKKIICNDVDVSGCEFVDETYSRIKCWANRDDFGYYEDEMNENGICYCENNPNCHYKQRARKTLECEELKEQLFEIKQKFKSFKKDANYYHKKYRTQRIKRIKIQNILEELINIILSFKRVEKYEHLRSFAEHAKEQMKKELQ